MHRYRAAIRHRHIPLHLVDPALDDPPPDVHPRTWRGQAQGTAVGTIVEHYMAHASGNTTANVRFTRSLR
jgi:hypothetical protein